MGESFYLVNLTDRVHTGRQGKLGEIIYDIGGRIITLLRGWNNPFPDFAIPLRLIEEARVEAGITLEDHSQDSAFLSLPDEIKWEIMSHVNPYYQDFLSMAMTCMPMLRLLAGVTTQVRCNMRKAMEAKCPLEREWSGKRIVLLGEYTGPGKDWSYFKQHVRTQIHEAAVRRGCTDLEDDIASAMSSLLKIGCPIEDSRWYEGEEQGGEESDEEDEKGRDEANPEAAHRITGSQSHLYVTCGPRAASRQRELGDLLNMSYLDINQRMLVQLPIRMEYNELARKIKRRRSDSQIRECREVIRRWEEDERLERCKQEMRDCEKALHECWFKPEEDLPKEDFLDCLRSRNDFRWVELSCAFRPFRIINLDTLEHLDPSVIAEHQRPVLSPSSDDYQIDAGFVLACNVTYHTRVGSIGLSYDGPGLAEGRWAGHRLRYATIDGRSSDFPTTDISLEMLALAEEIAISDGWKLGDVVINQDDDAQATEDNKSHD
ncbi:hypothetical protein FFLO_05850 [Filobasidium floriforme]|uniref:Uncharacterized protein n=1 Tax=Filobasidium floriforme TaxID=5210 RepID=A0A8K0JLN1_9TREE|nr:hypothetical protein FFLO_05850 [Filobasidium floriforme]